MINNAKISEFPPKWFNLSEFAFGACTELPMRPICLGLYNTVAGANSGEFYTVSKNIKICQFFQLNV